MEVIERFVLNDLPDNTWSVSWPGYEDNVVHTPIQAKNLLKILFDEISVKQAVLGCRWRTSDRFETMHIDCILWMQDPDGSAQYITRHHVITGCKFETQVQAEKFKLIMEQRLAWLRLGGKRWW